MVKRDGGDGCWCLAFSSWQLYGMTTECSSKQLHLRESHTHNLWRCRQLRLSLIRLSMKIVTVFPISFVSLPKQTDWWGPVLGKLNLHCIPFVHSALWQHQVGLNICCLLFNTLNPLSCYLFHAYIHIFLPDPGLYENVDTNICHWNTILFHQCQHQNHHSHSKWWCWNNTS